MIVVGKVASVRSAPIEETKDCDEIEVILNQKSQAREESS
jgi:hypothetical protein